MQIILVSRHLKTARTITIDASSCGGCVCAVCRFRFLPLLCFRGCRTLGLPVIEKLLHSIQQKESKKQTEIEAIICS